MTFFEIINEILAAHRNKDIVSERILMDMLDEVEPTYADTLDMVNY